MGSTLRGPATIKHPGRGEYRLDAVAHSLNN